MGAARYDLKRIQRGLEYMCGENTPAEGSQKKGAGGEGKKHIQR